MNKIRLDILGLSSTQTQNGTYALIMSERGGNRRLPIIIGFFEAQAISIELERIVPNRPMTHDLLCNVMKTFDIQLSEVIINDLREGIFYARMTCFFEGRKVEIDARPSDAIAVAIRMNVPIYINEHVLEEAGVAIEDDTLSSQEQEDIRYKSYSLQDYSDEQLRSILHKALEEEDYEKAAEIRDELGKREKRRRSR